MSTLPTTPSSYAGRVKTQIRNLPANGQDIGEFLLEEYARAHPEAQQDPHRWRMLSETVMRSAFDIAGNRYGHNQDGTQHSGMDRVFDRLIKKGMSGKKAFDLVLANLPSYTKGFVQTPHPTEVFSREGIIAEQRLHQELESNTALFNGELHRDLPDDEKKKVMHRIGELYESLEPLTNQLTPDEEMTRSIIFSEKMFDSIPLTMQAILDSAANTPDLNSPPRHADHQQKPEEMEYPPVYDGRPLTFNQLASFNFLIQPDTWSPGDRDSKSEMTTERLERGINRNKKAINQHYTKILAEIIADPETPDVASDPQTGEKYHVKSELRTIMWRVMQNINPDDMERYIYNHLMEKLSDGALAEVQALHNIRYRPGAKEGVGARNEALALGVSLDEPGYANSKEFLQDLAAISSTPGAHFPAFTLPGGRKSNFSAMDVLYVQANNFGNSALKSQIRENSEMHAEVMELVLSVLNERGIHVPGYDPENPQSAHNRKVIDALLDMVMDNTPRVDAVGQPMGRDEHSSVGEQIHEILSQRLDSLKDSVGSIQDKMAQGRSISDDEREEVKFYETLRGFGAAAGNADTIPRYLIAECHTDVDILEAFALLKMMEPNDIRHSILPTEKVDIVPLVEHREDVTLIPQMMAKAYENPHFRKHHNALTNPEDPAITITDPESGKKMPLTVARAKQIYHLPVQEGDDQKIVRATKLVMGAGSDIMKSAGAAGAALVQNMMEDTRERLLDLPEPVLLVDYTGSGGGIHRSQPVSSMDETIQGRSLRMSPDSIKQKELITLSKYMENRLHLDESSQDKQPDRRQKALTAQLNLGNMMGMPIRKDLWNAQTKDRVAAWMGSYEALYNSREFSAYLSFTADPFAKLTSFAARSVSRARSKGDKGSFPPLLDVKNLRAIGYGAALNTSGSCAPLFFGASAFLKLDEAGNIPDNQKDTLTSLYLQDFKTQDAINRATFGIVMADMDTAWAYLGLKRERDSETGEVRITNEEGKRVSVGELAQDSDKLRSAMQAVNNNPGDMSLEQKETLAAHVLAKIDMEYQRVSRGLLQLQRLAKSKPLEVNSSRSEAEQLMEELPQALRHQLEASRANINPERKFLAGLFRKVVKGEMAMPDRNDKDIYPQIYHSMGANFECFENAPRAYTRPNWAMSYELKGQQVSI